jgi:hypothetical protein
MGTTQGRLEPRARHISWVRSRRTMRRRLGAERIAGGGSMAIEKLAARPTTKRQEDIAALKLFCLLAFIFVVLIVAGIL